MIPRIAIDLEELWLTLRSIRDGVIATDSWVRITLINKVAGDDAGKTLFEIFHIINEKTGKPCTNPVTIV